MPRRKAFQDAARGLLGAFVSRNNDVGGYWAIGKLYAHARRSRSPEVRIDLIESTIAPPSAEFADLIAHHRQMLTSLQRQASGVRQATI
jgi:hypothetical protein